MVNNPYHSLYSYINSSAFVIAESPALRCSVVCKRGDLCLSKPLSSEAVTLRRRPDPSIDHWSHLHVRPIHRCLHRTPRYTDRYWPKPRPPPPLRAAAARIDPHSTPPPSPFNWN
ncbi:hypothetical protein J6590_061389 [Homalodisca vitripennis]|nr:hypothetical protein J6590_061389 [Homalodisca vitripennis]